MEPNDFLKKELIPVIEGLKSRNLVDFEEELTLNKERLTLKMTFINDGFIYLKKYLDSYIFPKLFATNAKFNTYKFGEVTNKKNTMYLELEISFD